MTYVQLCQNAWCQKTHPSTGSTYSTQQGPARDRWTLDLVAVRRQCYPLCHHAVLPTCACPTAAGLHLSVGGLLLGLPPLARVNSTSIRHVSRSGACLPAPHRFTVSALQPLAYILNIGDLNAQCPTSAHCWCVWVCVFCLVRWTLVAAGRIHVRKRLSSTLGKGVSSKND